MFGCLSGSGYSTENVGREGKTPAYGYCYNLPRLANLRCMSRQIFGCPTVTNAVMLPDMICISIWAFVPLSILALIGVGFIVFVVRTWRGL